MPTDFSITFSEFDRDWAEWIAWELEQAGFSTQFQGLEYGLESIPSRDADRTIFLLSEAAMNIMRTQPEWESPWSRPGTRARLLPMRVDDAPVAGPFARISYVDLVGLHRGDARERLLKAVGDRRESERVPSFPGEEPDASAAST